MKLTADQKRILKFIREHGPTTRRKIMDGAAGDGMRFITQDLLEELDVLVAENKITCQLNVSGKHIRLAVQVTAGRRGSPT